MGRLSPQRRAALRLENERSVVRRLFDLKAADDVKSDNIPLAKLDTFEPVGSVRPNSKGWEYSDAPKGALRARGHLDKSIAQEIKPGTRLVMPRKGYNRFSRA